MNFRHLVGVFCLISGGIFLSINSLILFRGAYRFGHDEIDKIAFGIAAAVVPWVIAVMPALIGDTWRKTWFGLVRPTASTMAVILIWVLFIAYNLTNGAGVIASSRLETVADRDAGAEATRALKDQREIIRQQLAGIPNHRPAETVAKLIEAEKTSRLWDRTDRCTDATATRSRAFCDQLRTLESELASALAGEKFRESLRAIDQKIAAAAPIVASSDPQADLLHDLTGFTKSKIQIWLPAATPIVLEAGASLMWHFGFMALGISLGGRRSLPEPQKPVESPFNPAPLISPERMKQDAVVSLEELTAQRKLCEWFFSHCTRHIADGSMPEEDWYSLYASICKRSNDRPLSLESFRRIAARYVPRISDVDGQTTYFEMMPLMPENAA